MKQSRIVVLNGQRAQKWIDTIISKNEFLQSIRVSGTEQNSGTVTMLDSEDYGLVIPQDRKTGVDFNVQGNKTINFECKEIVYPKLISDSDLEDMGINPVLMENLNGSDGKKVAEVLAKAFGKNLQDLIINGDTGLSGTGRVGMLKQKDGILKQLSDNNQLIEDSSYDTVLKEVSALYEAHLANEHHTSEDRIYIGYTQWADLINSSSKTSNSITYANGKLYYIDTLLVPTSRMTAGDGKYVMFIGNPKAVIAKIKRDIKLEIGRSMEYRGWKYLITTRIDWPIMREYFYGLKHETA